MNDNSNNNAKLSRREREKEAHRQEILDAAIKVFAEKGFSSATLDEIAQEAEFSKGTIYLYFSNKEDLLYSILDNTFKGWSVLFSNIITGKRKFREEITDMFNGLAEEIFKKPDIFALLSAQHGSLFNTISEEKRTEFCQKHHQFWSNFEARTKKAIENGELREIPTEGITGMVHGSLDAMLLTRWNCQSITELKNAIEIFMDILFNGIAKKKEI